MGASEQGGQEQDRNGREPWSPARRTVLRAAGAAGLGLATVSFEGQPASPASTTRWSTRTVAVVGGDDLVRTGTTAVAAALRAKGFAAANVRVDAARGRVLGRRDTAGRTVGDAIAAARDYFGGDPDVWLIDLFSPDASTTIAAQVRDVLRGLADNGDRRVVWLLQAARGARNAAQVRFNAVLTSTLRTATRASAADLHTFLHAQSGTIWSAPLVLTSLGNLHRARYFGGLSGAPTTGADGGWTMSALRAPRGRPTGLIRDQASGRTWRTVTYESLYRTGDTFQAALNRARGGVVVTLPPGVFEFSGFTQGYYDGIRLGSGGATGCVGLAGSGRGTILQMRANTGTAPTAIYRQLLAIDLHGAGAAYFGNFQLRGTDQRLDRWGGLSLHNAPGSVVEWLYCNGASKGYGNCPPGETMAIQVNRSNDVVVRDTEIDARHPVTRGRWGASPIGWNGSWGAYARNARVQRVYAHHALAGMVTFWLTNGVRLDNFHSFSCGSGTGVRSGSQINFEEVVGPVRVNYPKLYAHGSWYKSTQWPGDPLATGNNGFAFGQACTTTNRSDLVCLEPRFDRNVNGLMTTVAYRSYISSAGVRQKIVTPPTIIKNGVSLRGHDHNTRGWQATASIDRDFTWVR